MDQWLWKGVDF